MRHPIVIGGLALVLAGAGAAMAADVPDLKGTWVPAEGAHIIDGPTRHMESGTAPVAADPTLHRDTSPFVFRFEGQDGRTFWGTMSSEKVSEKLIGALSVDGKRFVLADEDGTFDGTVVDADTLDWCYTHVLPTSRVVGCGLLVRQK
jgi:hypothetical protein